MTQSTSLSKTPAGKARRGFLGNTIALLLGIVGYSVPVITGIVTFLNPLRQKVQAGQFMRLAALDVLPDDGTPRKFPVIADRTDAWNRFPNEPVGAVFLRRTGKQQVEALQVVCPHAGCFVGYDAKEDEFLCPCHNAHFDLSGKRKDEKSPSPRDLDTLEVEIRNDSEVWVKFENFQTGTPNKIVEA